MARKSNLDGKKRRTWDHGVERKEGVRLWFIGPWPFSAPDCLLIGLRHPAGSKVKVMYPLSDSHELLLSSWPRSILILWVISSLTLHFDFHQRKLAHLFVHQANVCPDDRSLRWSIINAACFKDISLHFVSDYAPARNLDFDWSYMELGFLLQPLSH